MFDLDSKESFTNIIKWERTMKDNGVDVKRAVIFLIGNKTDIKSKVFSIQNYYLDKLCS